MGKSIARIYLSNFEYNIQEIKKIAPNKKICLALKANAYGHGAIQIAKKAQELGVEFLSVATVSEGIELREAGIQKPILLLSMCYVHEIVNIINYSLTPLVADIDFVDLLCGKLRELKVKDFPVHVKIDTGMTRYGVQEEHALALALHIQQNDNVYIEGTCTHFSVSDSIEEGDIAFTKQQISTFKRIVQSFSDNNIDSGILHCAASGGVLLHHDSHFDMIRPGILTYGYFPNKELCDHFSKINGVEFRPVMELVSYVVALKNIAKGIPVSYGRKWIAKEETLVATVSIGYGDGLNRNLSDVLNCTIGTVSYPIIGRICMDQCVLLINKEKNVKRWDEVIVFGPKKGCNTAMELANELNTIPYEILCLIMPRVERIYI